MVTTLGDSRFQAGCNTLAVRVQWGEEWLVCRDLWGGVGAVLQGQMRGGKVGEGASCQRRRAWVRQVRNRMRTWDDASIY